MHTLEPIEHAFTRPLNRRPVWGLRFSWGVLGKHKRVRRGVFDGLAGGAAARALVSRYDTRPFVTEGDSEMKGGKHVQRV